jgi:hypothetical protein
MLGGGGDGRDGHLEIVDGALARRRTGERCPGVESGNGAILIIV